MLPNLRKIPLVPVIEDATRVEPINDSEFFPNQFHRTHTGNTEDSHRQEERRTSDRFGDIIPLAIVRYDASESGRISTDFEREYASQCINSQMRHQVDIHKAELERIRNFNTNWAAYVELLQDQILNLSSRLEQAFAGDPTQANLSDSGISIRSKEDFEIGETVGLNFLLSTVNRRIFLLANVIHAEANDDTSSKTLRTVGFRFTDTMPADLQAINSHLIAVQQKNMESGTPSSWWQSARSPLE